MLKCGKWKKTCRKKEKQVLDGWVFVINIRKKAC